MPHDLPPFGLEDLKALMSVTTSSLEAPPVSLSMMVDALALKAQAFSCTDPAASAISSKHTPILSLGKADKASNASCGTREIRQRCLGYILGLHTG